MPAKLDPTHTLTLRTSFVSDMTRRFNFLKRLSVESISKNDCFGLRETDPSMYPWAIAAKLLTPDTWSEQGASIPSGKFSFYRNPKKIEEFMEWLREMQDKSVLQTIPLTKEGELTRASWTNIYISRSYQHGMLWARTKVKSDKKLMRSLGLEDVDIKNNMESVGLDFSTAMHSDRVELLYTRTFTGLKGVTEAMDSQISAVLSEGMVKGDHPYVIAKNLSKRIEAIGITRAKMLARTEIIRAHHLAAIQTYRGYGVSGVSVEAEWLTARDSRVCPACAPINGKIFSLDKVEGMIPVHPQCRCAAVPVVIEQ